MSLLRHQDFSVALSLLDAVRSSRTDPDTYARVGVRELTRVIGSEITTLSVCNLRTGHRSVVSIPGCALSRSEIEAFDAHFHEHPLVRFHARDRRLVSHRISDSLSRRDFHRTGLYNDYYRRIGIDHAIAVPLFIDRELLVSFVLNRAKTDFSDRECELLDLVRPHLAHAYGQARDAVGSDSEDGVTQPLTNREREVIDWVARGKTDRDVGAVLGISARTVQKHLEHVFVKLGVETRTAAVVRSGVLRFGRVA